MRSELSKFVCLFFGCYFAIDVIYFVYGEINSEPEPTPDPQTMVCIKYSIAGKYLTAMIADTNIVKTEEGIQGDNFKYKMDASEACVITDEPPKSSTQKNNDDAQT